MSEQSTVSIRAAAITDRGLSEKRPVNEDSFLSDVSRRIFAVADGVGGAEAGEVASQTAMEVLDEAFRHQLDGVDVEDLMEIAIQRANSSIHRMAHEHPKFSMMATTVVALHLDGHIATIGHVGDSRLYRLTPGGELRRETRDHSVVEEEVRAGRMTPEQAEHHPSRNVISRALGAEEGVEVDTKTIEVEDGTAFLLCSDGITRHIPDQEIRELLSSRNDLEEVVAEMKRRCYERGAEDNLTAVIVRLDDSAPSQVLEDESERTVSTERSELDAALAGALGSAVNPDTAPTLGGLPEETPRGVDRLLETREAVTPTPVIATYPPVNQSADLSHTPRRSIWKAFARALAFLLLLAIVAFAAFFGGTYWQRMKTVPTAANLTPTTPEPTPDSAAEFAKQQRVIDQAPAAEARRMASETGGRPLESADP
ncbi:MAG TPA: PP2C family serine/threonine-protein phosphatase, partial [Pyrinomonadaceae bacterium]|nr:PP2C family serine/threonine-protein phosphatase [Pyrinomonadaceae bacterium]